MHRSTHIEDETSGSLAGLPEVSSPARRAGLTAEIIAFPARNAAAYGLGEEATELDEDVFHIGSVAVKLVGNFNLPRLLVVRQDLGAGCDPIAPPF
jgi:hypothetical protein